MPGDIDMGKFERRMVYGSGVEYVASIGTLRNIAERLSAFVRRVGDGLRVRGARCLRREAPRGRRLNEKSTEQEMIEAMGRGWANHDASIFLTLQEERANVQVRLPPV
jgi:hypothetical protein